MGSWISQAQPYGTHESGSAIAIDGLGSSAPTVQLSSAGGAIEELGSAVPRPPVPFDLVLALDLPSLCARASASEPKSLARPLKLLCHWSFGRDSQKNLLLSKK